MKIPDENDWRSEPWCLDIKSAYANFYGKNLADAELLLVENALYYQESIFFMPLLCFQYYVRAYSNYLLSDKSIEDCDGASCFFGLVEFRIKDIQNSDAALNSIIKETLVRLKNNQSFFNANPEIYGDFESKAQNLLHELERTK